MIEPNEFTAEDLRPGDAIIVNGLAYQVTISKWAKILSEFRILKVEPALPDGSRTLLYWRTDQVLAVVDI